MDNQKPAAQGPTFRHYLAYLIVVYVWPSRWLHVLWHPKFSEDFPLLPAAGFYAFWPEPEDGEAA